MSCIFLLALWPREAQDEVWDKSLDAILMGSLIFPAGRATAVDGGYLLSDRWPFGSGIDYADWNIFAGTDEEDGTLRMFVLPKSDYTVLDTWRATGLRATGSQDITVEDIFVPAHRKLRAEDTRNGESPGCTDNTGAVYRVPLFAMFFTWVWLHIARTCGGGC